MRETFRAAAPYLWRYRRALAIGIVTILLMEIVAVTIPLLIRHGVDAVIAGAPLSVVGWTAGLMLIAAAVKGALQFWSRTAFIGMSRDVEYDLRDDFFRHLLTLSPAFYQRTRTGDLMALATNDLHAVRLMIGPGLMNWFDACFVFVPAAVAMALVDWRLTAVALAPAPLVSLTVVVFGRAIQRQFERIQAAFSDLSSRVQETVAGVRVIRAFAQEAAEVARFERLDADYVELNLRLARISGLMTPVLQFLVGLTLLIVLWYGGHRLLAGQLTLGSYVMFNTYMAMLVKPMVAIGRVMNILQRGTASLRRLQRLMAERPAIAAPVIDAVTDASRHGAVPFRGAIDFSEVAVRFGTRHALDRVTLRLPAGVTTAIVGPTGSGKSVLVNLIPRLLDPDAGAVHIDGRRGPAYDPAALRRQIGIVPQETFLFSATLAENLAFGLDTVSDERLRWAVDVAGLGPDLDTFPRGLQTVVGERGISLSGGQKQRVAIARAILLDPRILILDDALASVDTVTEARILGGLKHVMRNRTTILISHRASMLRHADHIVVLDEGRIAQQGTHDDLIAAGGYYADLCREQQHDVERRAS